MIGEWPALFSGQVKIEGSPVAFQSCFYKTDCNVFVDKEEWMRHLDMVAELATSSGCSYLVIGSPLARFAPVDLISLDGSFSKADRELAEALCLVAQEHEGVFFGLEANPRIYGANVATNSSEAIGIVKAAGLANIGFHIDTGCLRMAGEDPTSILLSSSQYIRRAHISMPNLVSYDGSEKEFISHAIRLGIGLSYEARNSTDALIGMNNFLSDAEAAI